MDGSLHEYWLELQMRLDPLVTDGPVEVRHVRLDKNVTLAARWKSVEKGMANRCHLL
ncbi:hypothetical protein [Novosphingobium cyanobacteriorum]|uniref:Uncharacterized protein n=1 Tax=Novosphingobium cyanobacteriorum TaxID=3024215 RepID=A0ABT6CKA0_9SPHN|nr:hypothetical protein [Novosphingobium cyanobacteriorum]MDF8334356.1 hypothetical protein [Novosphingobium cyanobacteriorum]